MASLWISKGFPVDSFKTSQWTSHGPPMNSKWILYCFFLDSLYLIVKDLLCFRRGVPVSPAPLGFVPSARGPAPARAPEHLRTGPATQRALGQSLRRGSALRSPPGPRPARHGTEQCRPASHIELRPTTRHRVARQHRGRNDFGGCVCERAGSSLSMGKEMHVFPSPLVNN